MAAEKLNREIRREQIAEAALALISHKGARGLRVATVASRIGVVPSAVYRHFRGKDEIVSAAIGRMGELLLENVSRAQREGGDSIDRLRRLLSLHVRMIREGHAGPRIIFAEGIASGDTKHCRQIYQVICRYLDRVAEVIRQGQLLGEIRRDLDPHTASVGFMGLIQPAATLWHFSGGKFDAAGHAERAFALFAEAIAAR